MPLILHVDELRQGMRLFQAVMRGDQTLLPAGKVLEDWEINKLRRLFPTLSVRIGDPVLDEMVEFQDDGQDHEVAATVSRKMGRLMGSVRNKLSQRTALEASDIAGLQAEIHGVMQYLAENPVASAMLFHSPDPDNYLQEHAGNVFYLSLLVGNSIRDYVLREREKTTAARHLSVRYGMNLTPLALGGLFHDLGMIPLEHLYTQKEPLTEADRALVREHPVSGADMLPRSFDAVARSIIRTHHENCDGTGYPANLPKERLHVFSRIIRVADAFDAGTSHRVYAGARSPARILWEMSRGPHRRHYDQNIIKVLLSLIQPFPIGAKLRLNCGRYGVVVRHNRRHPFRPVVIMAFDEEGNKLKKSDLRPPIDLAEHEDITLVSHADEDLGYLQEASEEHAGDAAEAAEQTPPTAPTMFDLVYP